MKKHGIILYLVMSMFIAAFTPMCAFAVSEPFEIVQDKTALSSFTDIMKVDFSIPENSGYDGFEIIVSFPKAKLKVSEMTKGTAFDGAFVSNAVTHDDEAKAVVMYAQPVYDARSVLSLSFVKQADASGTAEIKITENYRVSGSEMQTYETSLNVDLGEETEKPTDEPSASPDADSTPAPSSSPSAGATEKPSSGNSGSSSRPTSTAAPTATLKPTDEPEATAAPDVPETTETPAVSFTDTDGHWAYDSIIRLAEKKLINGFEDNTFRPDVNVTRAQFVTMIVNAKGLDASASVKIFDDVDTGAWYAPYVTAAYTDGITSGDGVNFHPDSEITRQEAAAMAARAFDKKNGGELSFADNADIASWAADSVSALVKEGIINGFKEDNTFRPMDNTTRAQAAIILDKLLAE